MIKYWTKRKNEGGSQYQAGRDWLNRTWKEVQDTKDDGLEVLLMQAAKAWDQLPPDSGAPGPIPLKPDKKGPRLKPDLELTSKSKSRKAKKVSFADELPPDFTKDIPIFKAVRI